MSDDADDIVDRLRERADDKFIRDHPLMAEAAAEIERLRCELARPVSVRGRGIYSAWGLEVGLLGGEGDGVDQLVAGWQRWVALKARLYE